MISSCLKQKGHHVIERSHIDIILKEVDFSKSFNSDLSIADKLGKIVSADYIVIGAVTLYQSSPQKIYLPVKIKDEDKKEYIDEYNKCKDSYVNSWLLFWQNKEIKEKKLRRKYGVLSIDEYEDLLSEHSKEEYKNIASLGITAKIVDVKSSKIIWIGQAETTDLTLVNAAKRIVNEFYASIQDVN